jgi:hypothetical protein
MAQDHPGGGGHALFSGKPPALNGSFYEAAVRADRDLCWLNRQKRPVTGL